MSCAGMAKSVSIFEKEINRIGHSRAAGIVLSSHLCHRRSRNSLCRFQEAIRKKTMSAKVTSRLFAAELSFLSPESDGAWAKSNAALNVR
jgi:hypothetical protein